MKVLLTGSAGFIGSAIAEQLAAASVETVLVDLMLPNAHAEAATPAGTHCLDVRQAHRSDQWRELLDGVDVVCHQAALVGSGASVADLPAYAAHNDLGTASLLAAMAEANITALVLASSMVVYGEGRYRCEQHGLRPPGLRSIDQLDAGEFDNPCPDCGRPLAWELLDEADPLSPRSSYAASKLAQEHYAAAWARSTGGSVVALRYHNVYGPRMPRDTPYSGVAAMFRSSVEQGQPPQVYEDGQQARDFVHVADVARANLAAMAAIGPGASALPPGVVNAFNIASGEPITIADVATLIAAQHGLSAEITGNYRRGDVRHIVASPARARTELGFVATVRPEQGLAEFATAPLRTVNSSAGVGSW